MEHVLADIEKAMETLLRCQSLHSKISKLPNCNYRESLLKALKSLEQFEFTIQGKPLLAECSEVPTHTVLCLNEQIRHLENNMDSLSFVVNTTDKDAVHRVEQAVKDLQRAVSSVSFLIDKGSLSLD